MKLRSSNIHGTSSVRFDKKLLNHFKRHENNEAQIILQENPGLFKLIDKEGLTLLHHAVKYCNVDMVQYLIDSGVNVNIQDRLKRTALMTIQPNSDATKLIEILLKANAHVHLRDKNGQSGLQFICKIPFQISNIEKLMVHNLMEHYSDDYDVIAKLFLECEEPLLRLLFADDCELTQSLLDHGYPVDGLIKSSNLYTGKTALHIAVDRNDWEHVDLLADDYEADVNVSDNDGYTPIWYLHKPHSKSCDTSGILRTLIEKGAYTTILTEDSNYMQIQPVLLYGSRKDIQVLKDYDLDLYHMDGSGQSVLQLLALNSSENILIDLQGMDFYVNDCQDDGRTPLHYAVHNSTSVEFLLKNKADVNVVDNNGFTPLHVAFTLDNDYEKLGIPFACNVRTIELLLEYDADPLVESFYGTTAIEEAVDNNHFTSMKPISARDMIIAKLVREKMNRDKKLKRSIDYYARELERMKTTKIWESLTLYDLLVEDEDKLVISMRNKDFVLRLMRISYKFISEPNYYFDLIRRRVEEILRKAQIKSRAAVIVCKLMKMDYDAYYIISDIIVEYLGYVDLLKLIKL